VILPDVMSWCMRFAGGAAAREARELAGIVAGADELALHDSVLVGVVRLVTNPKIFAEPAPMPVTLEFLARLRAARSDNPAAHPYRCWISPSTLSPTCSGVTGEAEVHCKTPAVRRPRRATAKRHHPARPSRSSRWTAAPARRCAPPRRATAGPVASSAPPRSTIPTTSRVRPRPHCLTSPASPSSRSGCPTTAIGDCPRPWPMHRARLDEPGDRRHAIPDQRAGHPSR
jgi:hypothetical protein